MSKIVPISVTVPCDIQCDSDLVLEQLRYLFSLSGTLRLSVPGYPVGAGPRVFWNLARVAGRKAEPNNA